MDTDNLLINIGLYANQFTKTDKKIADYVLSHAEDVPYMSITELADACGVAEASIHRFCSRMKVKGYQEFKMRLSMSVKDSSSAVAASGTEESDNPFSDILEYHLNAIRETYSMLDAEVVNKTVEMMTNARQVYFLGVGNSMTTAMEAQGRFMHITPKVQCVMDSHLQAMAVSMLSSEDMIIFVSYSGSTMDNVATAQMAREHGVKISVITRYPKSPLTKYADTILICGSKEGPLEGGSMGAMMSQLHIIDVLFQTYYKRNLDTSRVNNKLTAEATLEKYVDKQTL